MTIKSVVGAAVTVSVASAFSLTGKTDAQHMQKTEARWSMQTDLPRVELQTKNLAASGCGKDVPGYFKIDGLIWNASWRNSKVWNTDECAKTCDENTACVGFFTRRGHGKVECSLYKGLQRKADHSAMSYMKCFKGFDNCQDGFQFSHAGTWRNGIKQRKLDDEDMVECQKMCKMSRACVAFTHRVNNMNDKFCFHFEDAGNEEGPTKESRANTYSKCVLEGSLQEVVEDNSTAEDNSTLENPASADEPGQAIGDISPVQAPASANESQDDEDSL